MDEQEDAVAQFLLLIKKLAEKLHEKRESAKQAKMMKQQQKQQKGNGSINKNSPMISKKQEIFNQIEERKNEGKAPTKQIVAGEKIPSRAEGKNEGMKEKEIDIKKLTPEERKKLKQGIKKELDKLQSKQKQVQKLRTQVNEIKAGGKGGGGKSVSLGHGGR